MSDELHSTKSIQNLINTINKKIHLTWLSDCTLLLVELCYKHVEFIRFCIFINTTLILHIQAQISLDFSNFFLFFNKA